jgi:hypothetical protein
MIVECGLPFGPEPFGNELKVELLTADGRNAEWDSRGQTSGRHQTTDIRNLENRNQWTVGCDSSFVNSGTQYKEINMKMLFLEQSYSAKSKIIFLSMKSVDRFHASQAPSRMPSG